MCLLESFWTLPYSWRLARYGSFVADSICFELFHLGLKVLTNGGFMTPPPLGVVTAKKLSKSGTSARWFCDTTSFKLVSKDRLLFQSLHRRRRRMCLRSAHVEQECGLIWSWDGLFLHLNYGLSLACSINTNRQLAIRRTASVTWWRRRYLMTASAWVPSKNPRRGELRGFCKDTWLTDGLCPNIPQQLERTEGVTSADLAESLGVWRIGWKLESWSTTHPNCSTRNYVSPTPRETLLSWSEER